MDDRDDAYLRGVHSPLGWSTLLYSAGGLLLAGSVILGIRATSRAPEGEISTEEMGSFIGCAVAMAGLVGALVLGGIAALLRWAARTLELGPSSE
jgi:hypothetical protein